MRYYMTKYYNLTMYQFDKIMGLIRSANQIVDRDSLHSRLRESHYILIVYDNEDIVACSVLKRPAKSYLQTIYNRMGLDYSTIEYEIGYIVVKRTHRRMGIASTMVNHLLDKVPSVNVIATVRSSNEGMNAILYTIGFTLNGNYQSGTNTINLYSY
jgi:ribosomal protein S18 acetylase RimI-like enzyme